MRYRAAGVSAVEWWRGEAFLLLCLKSKRQLVLKNPKPRKTISLHVGVTRVDEQIAMCSAQNTWSAGLHVVHPQHGAPARRCWWSHLRWSECFGLLRIAGGHEEESTGVWRRKENKSCKMKNLIQVFFTVDSYILWLRHEVCWDFLLISRSWRQDTDQSLCIHYSDVTYRLHCTLRILPLEKVVS